MDQSIHLHVSCSHLLESGWMSMHARVSTTVEPGDTDTQRTHWNKNVEAVTDEDHASIARGLFSEAWKVAERLAWSRVAF